MSSTRIRSLVRVAMLAALPSALAIARVEAGWPGNPGVNVPLCTAAGDQQRPTVISDGAGGAIVTWDDRRTGGSDIYVRRVSTAGVPQWAADGVALCVAASDQHSPIIVPDGAGGAIVTWTDHRNGAADLYVQRVNAAGVPQWTADGVALCTAANSQQNPTITPDGAGGAIVTWQDFRNGANNDVYAQRVNAAGVPQWTANGVALCTATGDQSYPTIASDGAGGAIATWFDARTGTSDIYVQRVSGTGVPQWTANGVALCTATGIQDYPTVDSDGAGGAIVTWRDYRGGFSDIYAQRVSGAGTPQWTANGVALCSAANQQEFPVIAVDGAGGAIVTWYDLRSGSHYDIYAQRVSAAGAPQWTADGVALSTAAGNQLDPTIVPDGAGGAVVTWQDSRSGTNDVYVQRLNAAGVPQWTASGVALCTAAGDQYSPALVLSGAGGAIVTWQDARGGSFDIYAQGVDRFGYMGAEPTIASVRDVPNDQGGRVKLAWYPSQLDAPSDPNLASYDIYRSAPGSLALEAARKGARLSASFAEAPVPGERSFVLDPLGKHLYAWEYLDSVTPVHFLDAYGYIAPTTGDSIGGSNPLTIFMVVARNASGSMYWLSAPDSGYSVDNLTPATPQPFAGTYSAGTASLHWSPNAETDFAVYRLYRGSSPGFVPGPSNLIATSPDTGHVDMAGAPYHYKLSAVDIHGNESGFALYSAPSAVDVPGGEAAVALALERPEPNPARDLARIEFALAEPGDVSLQIYDAGGRTVRVLARGRHESGRFTVPWDLRDDRGQGVGSGVYFVRLEAAGRSLSRRMVAIR